MADKKFNIFFAAPVRGHSPDTGRYQQIISLLNEYGSVVTEHIADPEALAFREENYTDATIFGKHLAWFKSVQAQVAEVSHPSLGVGYEIGALEALGVPILCIYREIPDMRLSANIAGNSNIRVEKYEDTEDLKKIFADFFDGLAKKSRRGDS